MAARHGGLPTASTRRLPRRLDPAHRASTSSLDFEDSADLQPYREVAGSWPSTSGRGLRRRPLAEVDVPCAAVIYADDPYVLRGFSEEIAGLMPTMRVG